MNGDGAVAGSHSRGFEKENPKHQALMKTLDFIAKKEGPSKVKLASQDLKRIWKMKQTRLYSRYTTELD